MIIESMDLNQALLRVKGKVINNHPEMKGTKQGCQASQGI